MGLRESTLESLGRLRAAVLGSSSSIFRSLRPYWNLLGFESTDLFSRTATLGPDGHPRTRSLSEFSGSRDRFDAVFNFVGTGNPLLDMDQFSILANSCVDLDSTALEKLRDGSVARYFSMSSGVAGAGDPENFHSSYANLKAHLEKRHRESGLPIVDVRIFGYSDIGGTFFPGSLVGDLYFALRSEGQFKTDASDPVRDYCGSDELASLLSCAISDAQFVGVLELFSTLPVSKMQLLEAIGRDSLTVVWMKSLKEKNLTGEKSIYQPSSRVSPIGYVPKRSSLEVVLAALGIGS